MNTPSEPQSGAWRYLRTILLGAAGSGVLFAASLAVPFIGFVAGFLAAVPLCHTRLTGGRRAALPAVLIATLLIGTAFAPSTALWFLAQCGLIGFLLPEFLTRGMRGSRALLWTTAVATLATVLLAFAMAMTAGQDIFTMAQQEITAGMDQARHLYEQQQGLSPQDLATIKDGMRQAGALLMRIFPALGTLNLLLVSSVSLLFCQRMAIIRGLPLSIAPFRSFRVPEPLIWILIVAGFSLLSSQTLITTPAMNLLAVLLILYFCQGLAVLLTLTDRTSYPGMLKVMLTFLLLVQPYLLPVVVILGIFDLWGDFRTPRTKQEENL